MVRTVAAAAAAAIVLLASPVQAANDVSIGHAEVGQDGTVSLLLDVEQLANGTTPDLGSIDVSVDGHTVAATASPVKAGEISRTTILTLDTSESMAGDRLRQAEVAAKAFLDSAPRDVNVGLITFSDKVHEVIAPTTDRAKIADAIDAIKLTRDTRIYDAVTAAVNLAGEDGARDVLLLTDGRDTGGGSTLAQATATAKHHGTAVDVVALDQSAADRALLSRIADASSGQVITAADATALESAFRAEADALASQLLVRFARPQGSAKEVELAVSLTAGGQTYKDSAYVSLDQATDAGPQVVEPGHALVGRGVMLAGAAGLALGLAVILAVVLLGARGQSESQKRVSAYLGETTPSAASPSSIKDSAVAFTSKIVKDDFETRLAQRLNAAGISFTAAEWILLHAGIAVASALLGFVLGGGPFLVMGLVAGLVLPAIFLKLKHARRLSAFSAQLPETLTLMSGGLSAGLSMAQAVDTVVKEGHEPMAGELRRALIEHRLGITIEDTLESVADRMSSDDFGWVVMAVRIQREVGGNLAEILNTVSDTLREREYLRRQVKSLSAEGRLSGWMLGVLPVGMLGYMLLANRDYASLLWTTGPGIAMSVAGVVLLSFGAFVMSRIVKVEV
ncbi:type II secretion system F family protein [Nocardioides ungokensis]|uniref:type II secretion system F family protein n=1 Tax=Nocardioides ungokensis TaxID=1643322 RepID=UPI0015DE7390|nr:type II secretion system F family protein [Nocardioides ungokensis]